MLQLYIGFMVNNGFQYAPMTIRKRVTRKKNLEHVKMAKLGVQKKWEGVRESFLGNYLIF